MNSEGPSNPRVTIAVTRQLNQLKTKAPDGVKIVINDADIFDIQADVEGPVKTPYEGGLFRCKLVLPQDFPKSPPKGYFITKIFHPNVSEKGEICVNTLKKDWNHQSWSFYNIFEVIKCLLIIPFPESALNEEAGKLFMEDYDSYFKYAKLMTEVHAKPKVTNKMEVEKEEASKKVEEEIPTVISIKLDKTTAQTLPANTQNSQTATLQNSQPQSQQMQLGSQIKINSNNNNNVGNPSNGILLSGNQTLPIQQNLQNGQQQGIVYNGSQFNLTQANFSNAVITNISINSPYKDSNKPQIMNNSQFLNGSSFQKNQNQENLQYQTNSSFGNQNNLSNPGLLNGSLIQEEPLCALSKNNGYYSNTVQSSATQGTSQQQKQPPQQFNKNNVLLNLTFNNYAVGQQSFVSTNINTNTNNGKQQNEKKKWLKRI
ncbi:ubiquitin-conjugating enzyme (macronuclear) [Tetrahymena thermophila SB210]|uniref:E2 ubiquitin-conjugating enzyme n=1 Tax=Tetrahymena thermophila (strain SB210) TaxID=312017 RepID=I7M6T0_TETTS|nr:ubiquitin-conjugating enzyme [Tetrahymena thermophila SB210]EAR86060.3 ubiquitin-conjugating enzyme [Tetrahymena thermophila SB210]|eukprot:XP_976655.3 ubiquitin-conjugating enzyme [Tetrahymena thermophila SB210]